MGPLKEQEACWLPEKCHNPGARNETENVWVSTLLSVPKVCFFKEVINVPLPINCSLNIIYCQVQRHFSRPLELPQTWFQNSVMSWWGAFPVTTLLCPPCFSSLSQAQSTTTHTSQSTGNTCPSEGRSPGYKSTAQHQLFMPMVGGSCFVPENIILVLILLIPPTFAERGMKPFSHVIILKE